MKRTAKRIFTAALALVLALLLGTAALAADPAFTFDLTVDGEHTKTVAPGDIVTVLLTLQRTDADAGYTMYAMQDEILYDPDFFELVEGGALLTSGVQSTDITLRDGMREFYMNYLSLSGGIGKPGDGERNGKRRDAAALCPRESGEGRVFRPRRGDLRGRRHDGRLCACTGARRV